MTSLRTAARSGFTARARAIGLPMSRTSSCGPIWKSWCDGIEQMAVPAAIFSLTGVGSLMKPQSVRTELRRYSTRTGAPRRITPHMLRHTAATLLIERGVDIRFVQRLLGHSSIATTEIYTHVSDEALRSTLERADVLRQLAA